MSKTLDIATASGGIEGGPEEDRIEAAYWRYDARHKGYGEWKKAPMSERDAFKAEMRNALAAEKMRAQARLIANGWRKPITKQSTDWFPPNVKPVHVGDYPTHINGRGHYKRHWNGIEWSGAWQGGESAAFIALAKITKSRYQNSIYWRGFTEPQE